MAKKEYQLKEKPLSAPKETAMTVLGGDKTALDMTKFTSASSDVIGMDKFEDLSLPPIIKTKGLKQGDVIFGRIQTFAPFHRGQIHSALITIHVLRGNPTTRKLEDVGLRASLPVGAVLARALGTHQSSQENPITPEQQIEEIKKNGWVEGTILALQYQGLGVERGDTLNKPHLWNIKAQKPTGETLTTPRNSL